MNLTRQDFTDDSLGIMDQVSHLVFIAQSVIEFGGLAAGSNYFNVAEDEAKKVAGYTEAVSADLLSTIFHTKKNRQKRQRKAYKKALGGFDAAHSAAMKLVEINRAATSGQGKQIGAQVVKRLEHLRKLWDDQCEAATSAAVTPA